MALWYPAALMKNRWPPCPALRVSAVTFQAQVAADQAAKAILTWDCSVFEELFRFFTTLCVFNNKNKKLGFGDTENGNALRRLLGVGTRRGVLISEVLRLPKEPVAGGDGWAFTWLPAICPVDSGGKRVTLRSLGMKPCRWGGEKSVGLGRDSDARVFAAGNLLLPAGRPLFAFRSQGRSLFGHPATFVGAKGDGERRRKDCCYQPRVITGLVRARAPLGSQTPSAYRCAEVATTQDKWVKRSGTSSLSENSCRLCFSITKGVAGKCVC